jgi:hypothetical protein
MIMTTQNNPDKIVPPVHSGEWSLRQIQEVLSRPLPAQLISTRRQNGKDIAYLSWHTVSKILDKYAPGWSWEICKMGMSSDRLFLVGRLTVLTCEGPICREATGTEALKRTNDEGDHIELAYGDPSSNAESMAFRRAAAKFGLGLYLYSKT